MPNDNNGNKVIFQKIDPREALVRECPSGCNPPLIFKAVPKLSTSFNSLARCVRCGTYWEVTPFGLVVNKRQWLETGAAMGNKTVSEEKKI